MQEKKKPTIKQKTTWTGLALVGFGIYSLIFGNVQEATTAIVTGLGLIFASDD